MRTDSHRVRVRINAADLLAAGSVTEGFGRLYPLFEKTASSITLTDPQRWNDTDTALLLDFLEVRQGEGDG